MTIFYNPASGGFILEGIHDIPEDAIEVSEEQREALLTDEASGKVIAVLEGEVVAIERVFTPEQIKSMLSAAVQAHMDDSAKAYGYDDIKSAVTYAEEPAVPKFQQEGQALRAWRSLCWAACYSVMADVESGARPIPSAAELVAELPELVMP